MRILSIGLDKKILDKNSESFQRQKEYAGLVEQYYIVIFGPKKEIQEGNLFVYGSGGRCKITQFINAYKIAKKIVCENSMLAYDSLRANKQTRVRKKDLKDWLITTQDPFFTGLLGYLLKRKFGTKLHVQIHGFEKFHGARRLIARFIISQADGFRVVSRRLKRELVEKFGVDESKITVVPIYTEKVQNAKLKMQNDNAKVKDSKFIFLTVGRLVPIKNIEMQIRAIAEIIKKYPDTELWIVGDGPEKKRLQSISNKLGIEQNVKFWGWQNNLEKFYNQTDVFLLTSNYEGWGLSVIEAANYSLPIIMTDVGCAGEIIKDGESGVVIPIGDEKALREAVIKLRKREELRKRLGENAKKAISKLPSKEETLELYKQSWQKTLKK